MRIIKPPVKLASVIAVLAAALVLLAATDGASAKNQARGNWDTNFSHIQNAIHPMIAKNDHGHKRRHRFSRLLDNQAYCNCSYESCPEWIIVQCVGYRPQHVAVRRARPVPRCICSISDLTDPSYD
jgi:hypothetical protein